MKKLIFMLSIIAVFVINAAAQSTTPRFGTVAGDDNTGRVLTYNWVAVTDKAGTDSINVAPHAWQSNYRVTLTDSIQFANPVVTKCYAGDNLRIIATGASGTKVTFGTYGTSKWVVNKSASTTGSAVLSTKGKAVIEFIFDGTKWIESGRSIE